MGEVNKTTNKGGRPKKQIPITEQEQPQDSKLLMTTGGAGTEVKDVLQGCTDFFNRFLGDVDSNSVLGQGIYNLNQYNPFLQNTRLKTLAGLPIEMSKDSIINALKNPQFHEEDIRGAAASLSSSQYLYYKILRQAGDIPLMKYVKYPPFLEASEYKTEKFKKDDDFVDEWLEKFDIVNTFKRIAIEVKREGKPSYLLRSHVTKKGGKKIVDYAALQKLPPQFVKLTAIGEHGFVASFNLMVFMNPAFVPDQYPAFIQRVWSDMINNKIAIFDPKKKSYRLDVAKAANYAFVDRDGNSYDTLLERTEKRTYMFWVQLPQDLCYTFCSDTSTATAAPDTAGLFMDLQELTDYSVLAGLIASTPLTSLLTGEIELIPNPSTGRDQTAMNPETVLKFQNLFNSMTSTNTEAFFAPLKNLKLQSLNNVPNSSEIKTKALSNFISGAGEGGNIIATEKPSIAQVKTANMLSAAQYDFVVKQFKSALNNIVQECIGADYKWKVDIFGDIFSEQNQKKYLKELVTAGMKGLVPKLLAYEDITVKDSKAAELYLDSIGFYDNLTTLTQVAASKLNTQQEKSADSNTNEDGSAKKVGRPALEDEDIESDETAASREKGENTSENKDIYAAKRCAVCGAELDNEDDVLCDDCCEAYLEEHN